MKNIFILVLVLLIFFCSYLHAQENQKNRAIILTDIEADPDDTQSMVRLLLYSNEIDLKGLIATTSTHQRNNVYPESIRKVIHAYGKVHANLMKHEADFPNVEYLFNLVKQGLPLYGMNGVGDGKDSPGSEWIIKILEENDKRPLWVCVWGGANTLAQALYKIRKTKSEDEVKLLIAKLRVYTISDQDDSGIWIRKNFQNLFYIVSPGGYEHSTWGAITAYATGMNSETISNSWLANNIQQGHGPLGAVYPDVAYGMEGDTPSFLSLIPNGLNAPENPEWGGWGGRYEKYIPDYSTFNSGFTGGVPIEPETREIWTNAFDNYTPYMENNYGRAVRRDTVSINNNRITLWRWRDDFQYDFAARMDWCTKPYSEANHPPVPASANHEQITVKSGEVFSLDDEGTTDPDGDNLSYLWFQYPEAGTCNKSVKFLSAENIYRIYLQAPEVEEEETIHIILKVTDKGQPPLSRYKRVIVKILSK
ncbi:MAG: nucleoside hydrolase-like domain-containing protein [bacterium]